MPSGWHRQGHLKRGACCLTADLAALVNLGGDTRWLLQFVPGHLSSPHRVEVSYLCELPAFWGLLRLGFTGLVCVPGRTGCADDARIHDRAGVNHKASGVQILKPGK